jgi:hypothetical protein
MKTLAAVLAIVLLAAPAFAKADFSGEWKLNLSKSDFGPLPAPTSVTENITHQDPALKLAIKQTSERGDREYQLNYSTDGKETTNEMRGNPVKSVAKWDGDTLVIDTKGSFDGNDFSVQDRMSLSPDGKVLTVKRHFTSSMGEADQTMVLEKQ